MLSLEVAKVAKELTNVQGLPSTELQVTIWNERISCLPVVVECICLHLLRYTVNLVALFRAWSMVVVIPT